MSAADDDSAIGGLLGSGRYEVLALLGRGGMGDVYRARDTASSTEVALKTLHRHLAAEARHLARFRREAEVTAALSHPNIVAVLDHGVEADGTPWLVMELLGGESLSKLASREAPIEVPRVVRIGRQLAYALAAVHGVGVVHRDLKPGNVMTSGPGGRDEIKVVDFGIARFFGTGTYEKLTATGQVIGTPSYMAPEQAFGGVVDGRTDIYAVGAILSALLTGTPPHGAGDFYDVLTRLLGDERIRLGESHPHLGPVIDVVEGCLAFDPEQRYGSMAELDAALRRLDPSPSTTLVQWSPRVPLHTLRIEPDPVLDAVADTAQTAFLRAARDRGPGGGAPPNGPAVHSPARSGGPWWVRRGLWVLGAVGLVFSVAAVAVVAAVLLNSGGDDGPSPVAGGPPATEATTATPVIPVIPAVAPIAPTPLHYPAAAGADAAPSPDPEAVATMRTSGASASGSRGQGMQASASPRTPAPEPGARLTFDVTDSAAWTRAQVRAALRPGGRRGNVCLGAVPRGRGAPATWRASLNFEGNGELDTFGQGSFAGGHAAVEAQRCVDSALLGTVLPGVNGDLPRSELQVIVRVTLRQ